MCQCLAPFLYNRKLRSYYTKPSGGCVSARIGAASGMLYSADGVSINTFVRLTLSLKKLFVQIAQQTYGLVNYNILHYYMGMLKTFVDLRISLIYKQSYQHFQQAIVINIKYCIKKYTNE